MTTYRTLKELPGVPVGSEVKLEDESGDEYYVYFQDNGVAYIPKSDLPLWLQEVVVKKIEPIQTYTSKDPDGADMSQFVSKLNELITAFNSLPPADKIMVKE